MPLSQRPTTIRREGFTLVELLSVIAVIAALATLSAGAGVVALRKARNAKCQSNLKQLGIALASYAGGRGHFPGWTNPEQVEDRTNAWLWCHSLEREMTSSDEHIPSKFRGDLKGSVWDCPSTDNVRDTLMVDYGYNVWGMTSSMDQKPLGLGGKIRGAPIFDPVPPQLQVSEGDVTSPSRMIALGDGASGWGDGFMWTTDSIARQRPPSERQLLTPFEPSRHQRRVNVEFVDGHVETASLRWLFVDAIDEGMSVWNRDHLPHRERLLE